MRVLVTGFAPFGGETVNPSWEAVRRLPGRIGRAEVTAVELPVSFAASGGALAAALRRVRPDVVLCTGQAGGRAGICVERVAVNLQDAAIPDNDGAQPHDRPIRPDGPAAYFATLPTREIVSALCAGGIPAALSYSAGTYVCNHLFYTLMDLLAREERAVYGGFLHVPYSSGQAAAKSPLPPGMELGQMTRALETAIQVCCADLF